MTYQIYRYPAELIDVVHLTDGERVVIRPVLPQDRELMVAFFHDLSADARCERFMHPVSEPSSELLRQFTQVDYANHVALVAEVFVDGRETVISEARYVRAADPSSAEVSVSVAEPWQGKGLAKLLLTKLECRAAAAGVRRIFGETLASNERMLSLARKAGFVISESLSARGVMRLEKTLAVLDHVANNVPRYVGRQPQPRVTE
jgi:RimJ/RimL family protein N-acetyltransferase